jgi:hypothetical protein
MRGPLVGVLAVVGILLGGAAPAADDAAAKLVEKQKQAAEENFAQLDAGEGAVIETAGLLVCGPKPLAARLRQVAPTLQKHHDLARKALAISPKEDLWKGKLTVYVLPEREQFTTFIRRIEKRRLDAEDVGSLDLDGDTPHVAGGPPRTREEPSAEGQAGEQVARAVLTAKAGLTTPLPAWLLVGFGRATAYRASPSAFSRERALASRLVTDKKRTARDVYAGSLDDEEMYALRGSLADYLAYGPGAARFPAFVGGFRPGEGQASRTTEQALDAAAVKPDVLDTKWREWVPRAR